MLRWLGLCVLLCVPMAGFAAPGLTTLSWDAPVACANGEPFASSLELTYTLYQATTPGGYDFNTPWLTGLTDTTLTLSARGKKYWVVTATGAFDALPEPWPEVGGCTGESEPSNEVPTHQTGRPDHARAGK